MGLFDRFKKNKGAEQVSEWGLLFCLEPNPQEALHQIELLFQMRLDGGPNQITLRQKDMKIELTAFGAFEEGENGAYAREQLQGIWDWFRQVETGCVDIQRNLLYHLRQCQGILQLVCSFEDAGPEEAEEKRRQLLSLFLSIAGRLQGLVLFGDENSILDSGGNLILDQDGNSELDFYMPAEVHPEEGWCEDIPPECRERRERSIARLQGRHIYVTPWLPFLGEQSANGPARSAREICGRAAALLLVSLYSECRLGEKMSYQQAREFTRKAMGPYLAEEFLSPGERAYWNNPGSTQKEQIPFSWRYESLLVMEWALGLAEELPWPTGICDVAETVQAIQKFADLDVLVRAASPRPYPEILDAADLIYRLDWACVDARVMGMPAPAGVEPGVVSERHHALFWLAGCDGRCGWDEVNLST